MLFAIFVLSFTCIFLGMWVWFSYMGAINAEKEIDFWKKQCADCNAKRLELEDALKKAQGGGS